MTTWVLLVVIHVGAMGSGNSNAITSVSGFVSQQSCEAAGKVARTITDGTVKETRTVCLKQEK